MTLTRRGAVLCGLAALWAAPAGAQTYYVAKDGQVTGPFDVEALKAIIGGRSRAPRVIVWTPGMTDWAAASEVPELAAMIALLPFDPPVDFKTFIIGKWETDPHIAESPEGLAWSKREYEFMADGDFFLFNEPSYSVAPVPWLKPGEKRPEPEQEKARFWAIGKFTAGGPDPDEGFYFIRIDGGAKNKEGKVSTWKEEFELRIMGDNHMRSRFGLNYRRRLF